MRFASEHRISHSDFPLRQICARGNRIDLPPNLLQRLSDQKRQFQRLIRIHPRIAVGVVTVRQAIFGNRTGAADAFGNVLAGHLDMNPARVRALGLMHLEELLHLAEDLGKVASFVAAAGLDGIPVHRV